MQREKIDVERILADILGGLGDVPIMEKYDLSPTLYGSIIDRLRRAGKIKANHLAGRMHRAQKVDQDVEKRAHKRNYVLYPVTVHDANHPSNTGVLNDITRTGFQVQGLEVEVDEIGTYTIRSDALAVHEPFMLDAICRWQTTDEQTGQRIAGFEISAIRGHGKRDLDRLIDLVAVTE
jgi:hypothetical protein